MKFQFKDQQRGMSLVETIFALALFAMVIVAASTVIVNHANYTAKMEDLGEAYDLRQYVRNSMDCATTFADQSASASCSKPGGGRIDIRDRFDQVLVSKSAEGSKLFDYKLRVNCVENSGVNEILIDYLPVNATGAAKKDALSRQSETWQSLTDQIPLVCPRASQLIFSFVPRKTTNSERSRELLSQLCTNEAKTHKLTGKFKALISLTPIYATHPDDKGKPFDAIDYITVRGAVKNSAGQTVAASASEFWSINHKANIPDLNKVVLEIGYATGTTPLGRYPTTCALEDPGGTKQS